MSKREVVEFIENQILQVAEGFKVETNKLDFKREWYNLKNEDDGFEFLKDVTSIVNSYGGASGFLVIGVDENDATYDCPFKMSGIKDENEILGIIKRKVDRPFNIELIEHKLKNGNIICIIHIPPSLEKPHVIRCYKKGSVEFMNEIFVRKSSSTERASKSDIDLMYAEKGSILIEKNLVASVNIGRTKVSLGDKVIVLAVQVILENTGIRNLSTLRIDLHLEINSPQLAPDQRKIVLTIYIEITVLTDKHYKEYLHFSFVPNLDWKDMVHLVNYFNEHRVDPKIVSLNFFNILLTDGTNIVSPIQTINTGQVENVVKTFIQD